MAEVICNRAHIIGLSLGSSIALSLLSTAPEVVDHAIVDGAGVLPLSGFFIIKAGIRVLQPFLHTNIVIRTIAHTLNIPDENFNEFRKGMLSMFPTSFTS